MKIVFCIDKNYENLATVSIASYRRHNPYAEIIVVSEEPIKKSIGYDKNIIYKLERKFRNRGEGDRISNTAYMKCFLTELPFKKILYVDADTICQKPLDKLWNMKCKYINLCESHKYGKIQAKAIGSKKYGLTGMMLMNLENLRKADFTYKCLYIEKNLPTPETGWQHDETCINVAMRHKLRFISQKWNYCLNREYEKPKKYSSVAILHYVGKDKTGMLSNEPYAEAVCIKNDIKGKNVAIVGNARSIFDRKYGEQIDSADFIIRFNKGFIIKPESQGKRTDLLMLGTDWITQDEIKSFNAKYVVNRSEQYNKNNADITLGGKERKNIKNFIGSQPSTGFIAIDLCLYFDAKTINLYGFDFEETPTFYNPEGYKTQHNYPKEKEILLEYEKNKKIIINR